MSEPGDSCERRPLQSGAEILVIEDDPEMAAVLRAGFKQDRLAVRVASDGVEGLRVARDGSFCAIVLDVLLPKMDGYEVALALRKDGNPTPILMLTARDGVSDIVHGFECGAEDYLTKPFSFLELSARVRALIRRSQPPVRYLEVSDLCMNLATHQVARKGRQIHLTKMEFLALELLMRNASHVVQRQEFLRAVWKGTSSAAPNNLDVTISALRNKVDQPGECRLIHTVRGFGYRISPD